MSFAFVLFFPLFMVLFIFGLMMALTKKANTDDTRRLKEIRDSGLPETVLNQTLEISNLQSIQITHTPKRPKAPSTLCLQLNGSFGSAVFLSPELKGDLFLKYIGMSQEAEINDPELDALFHIVAENPDKTSKWMQESSTRNHLLELGRTQGFEYFEIRPNFCKIYFSNFKIPSDVTFDQFTKKIGNALVSVSHSTRSELGETAPEPPTGFSKRFSLFEPQWINTAFTLFLIPSILFFVGLIITSIPLIHPKQSLLILAIGSLSLIASIAWLLRPWIRSFQIPSKAFFTISASLLVFLLLGLSLVGLCINRYADNARPRIVTARVLEKYINYGKNHSPIYFVRVQSRDIPRLFTGSDTLDLSVRGALYNDVVPGHTEAWIQIYPGLFYIPWYDKFGMRN